MNFISLMTFPSCLKDYDDELLTGIMEFDEIPYKLGCTEEAVIHVLTNEGFVKERVQTSNGDFYNIWRPPNNYKGITLNNLRWLCQTYDFK